MVELRFEHRTFLICSPELCQVVSVPYSPTPPVITFCSTYLMAVSTRFLLPPCLYRVCVSVGMGGRARCKGTDGSLFDAGSPACCQQALWPAPTPPSWLQALLDSSSWCPASTSPVGGEEAAETGFPGLTEQWPGQLPLTHIPTWMRSKEIPPPVSSRWTCESPLMCANTYTFHNHT